MVYDYEKVEDLGLKGYKIIQNKSGFCFGSDAVLLSRFTKLKKGARVLDLCTGSGIIPVLLWGMNELSGIDAVELVPSVADMARRTMELNGLSDKIRVHCDDIKNVKALFGAHAFDAVSCNPPYMNVGGGIINPKDTLALAKSQPCGNNAGAGLHGNIRRILNVRIFGCAVFFQSVQGKDRCGTKQIFDTA